MTAAPLVARSWAGVTAVVEGLSPRELLRPTRAEGWAVQDLLFHLLLDAQRALVALATPEPGPATVDAAAYFRRPPSTARVEAGEVAHARYVRVSAAAYASGEGLVRHWRDTSEAAARAVAAADPAARIGTQGHVLTVDTLAQTLVAEAAIHHLDLVVALPDAPGPGAEALALVRRLLERQRGGPLPAGWDDAEAALKGSGRLPLTAEDRAALGAAAAEFPLLG